MAAGARWRPRGAAASGGGKSELFQLLAQRSTIDPENAGGAALVAFSVVEDYAKQRLLHFAQHQVVQMGGSVAVQAGEILAQRAFGVISQRQIASIHSGGGFTRPSLLFCRHVTPRGKNRSQAAMAASPTHSSKCLSACANCAVVF